MIIKPMNKLTKAEKEAYDRAIKSGGLIKAAKNEERIGEELRKKEEQKKKK